MRVELIYHPACLLYKSIHKVLEDVIAEERLPIPVEMVQSKSKKNSPSIRIDGHIIFQLKTGDGFEHLRELVTKKWFDLNNFCR